MRRLLKITTLLLLGACADRAPQPVATAPQPLATAPAVTAPSPIDPARVETASSGGLLPYPDTKQFLQCVTFARAVTGIDIHGDAWTWWDAAAGHYRRGHKPEVGAVIVFKRTAQMKLGHVSVVVEIQDSRHALVSHANWGYQPDTRGVIHERTPVKDVSPNNDWSEIVLMNRLGSYGGPQPAYGFVYRDREIAQAR